MEEDSLSTSSVEQTISLEEYLRVSRPSFQEKVSCKRRVLQKPLVESIVDSLMPGGQNGHPQITKKELTSANDGNVAEDLT
ncbi:hypothetical protein LOK49_LG06G01989 [Camellia lanceoleosa]|uniref:Uncharacterized protein n=1 Tax=Camellia lanceoleosa TaxID=1840588 RepID=A0ACC0HFX8_9ERIC|nr:hypothetical protein LOK49_LG06G01989 [Camellia lanceoleosa]